MHKFKYFNFEEWTLDARTSFDFHSNTFTCSIEHDTEGYYINIDGFNNGYIFEELCIDSPSQFCKKYVKDSSMDEGGNWPYVDTIDDLKRVCIALESLMDGREPSSQDSITGPIKISTKKTSIKLNFKL